jgi:hypothetical protein
LLWEGVDRSFPKLPLNTMETLNQLLFVASASSRSSDTWSAIQADLPISSQISQFSTSEEGTDRDISNDMAAQLSIYARNNAASLLLDPSRKIEVQGFHPVFRIASDGRLLIELVAQFAQKDERQGDDLGGVPIRGGTTLVASADGTVRYLIAKPLLSSPQTPEMQRESQARYERQINFVRLCDSIDASCAYSSQEAFQQRMTARMQFAALHQGALG